jgi:type III secretory pathway lipoprotein EscJ
VAVTFAPATNAPFGSDTVPVSVAVIVCAETDSAPTAQHAKIKAILNIAFRQLVIKFLLFNRVD